ncbi:MAG: EscU/YscU/HrcU family type III secretion system export apparatus switch protein [Ilumatobacteraceae bacterium]
MSKREGRTERPTQKRLKDARRKGQVAVSQDLSPWISLLVGSYLLPGAVHGAGEGVRLAFDALDGVATTGDPSQAVSALGHGLLASLLALVPLFAVIVIVAILSHAAQTGGIVSFHRLKPDFKRVNPFEGFKRLLSPRRLWDTARQVAKAAIVTFVVWPRAVALVHDLARHRDRAALAGIAATGSALLGMVRAVAWTMVMLALADYAVQRHRHRADLKMTKQEVKDEMRHSEGDPHQKGRIRQIQADRSRRRMMSDVPLANVIITNPTHIAVAVRYDPLQGAAPKVVAIGIGAVAKKIRTIGAEAGVPVVEAKPLARALWRSCDVGDAIPIALYEAVARVLVFVRQLGRTPTRPSAIELPRSFEIDPAVLEQVAAKARRRTRSFA